MITQAAIKFNGGVYSLEAPNRHADIKRHFGALHHRNEFELIEGFIDDKDGFVNRKRAAMIAVTQKQIEKPKYGKHGLYSDDLW